MASQQKQNPLPSADEIGTELEQMVDRAGIRAILYALEYIAWEKADHVLSSYNNEPMAGLWRRMANKLGKAALDMPKEPEYETVTSKAAPDWKPVVRR